MTPFLPPPLLHQIAEEERQLNARCLAAGLPPFPTSSGWPHQYSYGLDSGVHAASYNLGGHQMFLPPEQIRVDRPAMAPPQQQMIPLEFLKLKAPKIEHEEGGGLPISAFGQKRLSSGVHRLPGLQSMEADRDPSESLPEKSPRCLSPLQTQPSLLQTNQIRSENANQTPPTAVFASAAARRRRKNLSERMRILAGLMPWEKKATISTTLEEAHKYVKFLEAQVTALQYMPPVSYFRSPGPAEIGNYGGLEKLNRQQLLQVLVNSTLLQDKLYSRGFCIYSVEQMVLLRRILERKLLMQKQQEVVQESGSTISS